MPADDERGVGDDRAVADDGGDAHGVGFIALDMVVIGDADIELLLQLVRQESHWPKSGAAIGVAGVRAVGEIGVFGVAVDDAPPRAEGFYGPPAEGQQVGVIHMVERRGAADFRTRI